MAISLRASGLAVNSTSNITPVIPAGAVAGDLMILSYGTKPFGDNPSINNGWTLIGSATDGTVAGGIDTGSMKTIVWYKIHTGTESDPTITNTTNSVSSGRIDVYSCNSNLWFIPVGSGGGDATAGTDYSVTLSDVGWKVEDAWHLVSSFRSDAATNSGYTVTYNGIGSYGTSALIVPSTYVTSSGQDMALAVGSYRITTFSGTLTSIVASATLAAAHTGSSYLVRLRENLSPTVTLQTPTDTATGVSLTPTLSFTGTDPNSDTIEYNIQIDDINTFANPLINAFSEKNGGFTAGNPYVSGVQKSFILGTRVFDAMLKNTSFVSASSSLYVSMGQSFIGTKATLNSVVFKLRKVGSPAGTLEAKLFAHTGVYGTSGSPTGTALAVSNSITQASVSTSVTDYTFTFPSPYLMTEGTFYVIAIVNSTAVATNYIDVYMNNNGLEHSGNYSNSSSVDFTSPQTQSVYDLYFKLNGTDSDLTVATVYYWRVRAIDLAVSNTYGAWSSIFSFTTVGGAPVYNETITLTSANVVDETVLADLAGLITLLSANVVDETAIGDFLHSVGLTMDITIPVLGNLLIDVALTITSANVVDEIGGLDFQNTITLTSDHLIDEQGALLINGNVGLASAHLIPVSATLDILGAMSLLSDNSITNLSELIVNGNIALAIDETLSASAGLVFENAATLSSDNTISMNLLLTMDQITTLTQDTTITNASQSDSVGNVALTSANVIALVNDMLLSGTISLATDNLVSLLGNIDLSQSTLIVSENAITVQVGSDFLDSIVLTLDNAIANVGSIGLDVQINLATVKTLSTTNVADIQGSLLLASINNIDSFTALDIQAVIDMATNNTVSTSGLLEFFNAVNLSTDHSVSVSSIAEFVDAITLATDNVMLITLMSNFMESIQLNSDNTVSVSVLKEVFENIALATDNTLLASSVAEFVASTTLASDHSISASLSLVFDNSVSLDTINQIAVLLEKTLDETITVTSANTITVSNIATLENNVSVSIDAQQNIAVERIMEVVAQLTTDNALIAFGGFEFVNVISLTTDNTVLASAILDLQGNVQMDIDGQLSNTATADLSANLQILSDNQLSDIVTADLGASLQLLSEGQFSALNNAEIALNISLASDNQIEGISQNDINTTIFLQTDHEQLVSGGLEMNEDLTLQTDSTFLEDNLAEYLNNTMITIDGQVLCSLDGFTEALTLLASFSQMTVEQQADALADFELQIDNQVLFEMVMEVYEQLTLSQSAFAVFDVLKEVNVIFDLNLDTQILFSVGDIFENSANLAINSTISFSDGFILGRYLKNEIFFRRSTITNNLLLKSFISNVLLQNVKTINLICLKSEITNLFFKRSDITNYIILISKIY